MPQYSARVGMARRTGITPVDGVTPFVIEEVLIDAIKAGSQKKAARRIMDHAARHTGYRFPLTLDREQVPDPVMIEIVRLDKEGKPVDKKFSMVAPVTIKPLETSNPTGISKPTYKSKFEQGAANKTGTTTKYVPPKLYPLADPMTEDFLKTVMEIPNAT